MRIWTPMTQLERWWLTILYRETGKPHPLRVGSGRVFFGGPPREIGKLYPQQFEIVREQASIEVFPGAIIYAITAYDKPGLNLKFMSTLSEVDGAELVRPSEILIVGEDMLGDLTKLSPSLQKQLTPGRRVII